MSEPAVDFYNLYAQHKYNVPSEWRWHTLRGKTIGGRTLKLTIPEDEFREFISGNRTSPCSRGCPTMREER